MGRGQALTVTRHGIQQVRSRPYRQIRRPGCLGVLGVPALDRALIYREKRGALGGTQGLRSGYDICRIHF